MISQMESMYFIFDISGRMKIIATKSGVAVKYI